MSDYSDVELELGELEGLVEDGDEASRRPDPKRLL
jgi:hypothetical protein